MQKKEVVQRSCKSVACHSRAAAWGVGRGWRLKSVVLCSQVISLEVFFFFFVEPPRDRRAAAETGWIPQNV